MFAKADPLKGNLLSAIKWIGNDGSHSAQNIDKEQLVNGLIIIEFLLKELYDVSGQYISQIAESINNRYKKSPKTIVN